MDLVEAAIAKAAMKGQYCWERRSAEYLIELGEKYREWRKNKNLTIEYVAQQLDISKSTLAKFEKGQYTSYAVYVEFWYRMLLTGNLDKFRKTCKKNRWFTLLCTKHPQEHTAFRPISRRVI